MNESTGDHSHLSLGEKEGNHEEPLVFLYQLSFDYGSKLSLSPVQSLHFCCSLSRITFSCVRFSTPFAVSKRRRMQGAAAGAEGKKSGSPSTAMGKGGGGDQSAEKKPRLEPPPNVQVKQEITVHQATTGGGGGGGAIVAAEDGSRVKVQVKMDTGVLHCPICSHPFKPPLFRCTGGHMACGSCLAEMTPDDKQCRKCGRGFERCPALEEVVSSAQIECAHDGCGLYVTYHEAGAHQSSCPHAPCSCTEPGCGGFQGAPAALLAHLAARHAMPVHMVPHARAARLHLPAPSASATERHLVIVEGDEDGAFLLTVSGGPAGITAVSAVCIRAGGPPWYAVKMWANGPPLPPAMGRKVDAVWVDILATCSSAPGAVDVEELTMLTGPRKFLVGGAAGAAKELPLNIRIDTSTR